MGYKNMADSLIDGLALRLRKTAFACGGLALVGLVVAGIELEGVLYRPSSIYAASGRTSDTWTAGSPDAPGTTVNTEKLAELLDQARSFIKGRNYGQAEDIYRSILKTDPSNASVKRLLASALFRQEKIDQSLEVVNSIQATTRQIH
jgi:hypothetical protein